MLLPMEHKLIFEFALIAENRTNRGYCLDWNYKVMQQSATFVTVRFDMEANPRWPDFGNSDREAMQARYEIHRKEDSYLPAPYVHGMLYEGRNAYVTSSGFVCKDSYVPRHLWGLPPRVMGILLDYQDYKEATTNTTTNTTEKYRLNEPTINLYNGCFDGLRHCDSVAFACVPNHGVTSHLNQYRPISNLIEKYLDHLNIYLAEHYTTEDCEKALHNGTLKI